MPSKAVRSHHVCKRVGGCLTMKQVQFGTVRGCALCMGWISTRAATTCALAHLLHIGRDGQNRMCVYYVCFRHLYKLGMSSVWRETAPVKSTRFAHTYVTYVCEIPNIRFCTSLHIGLRTHALSHVAGPHVQAVPLPTCHMCPCL
jgi:hypothetical protein